MDQKRKEEKKENKKKGGVQINGMKLLLIVLTSTATKYKYTIYICIYMKKLCVLTLPVY